MMEEILQEAKVDKDSLGDFNIDRGMFIPSQFRNNDTDIDDNFPLGTNRYLMSSRNFAKILQLADVRPTDNVLDIGCATGYSAAIISRLAKKVTAIEVDYLLYTIAVKMINRLRFSNVEVVNAPLGRGNKERGPYSIIFINGAIKEIPDNLFGQLNDGGKIISIIYKKHDKKQNSGMVIGEVILIEKKNEVLSKTELLSINCFTLDL